MHFVCTYTWGNSSFMMLSTDAYIMMMIIIMPRMTLEGLLTSGRWLRRASPTMMGPGDVNHLGIHAHTCGSCVGKYYTSNFVWTRGHPYDDFNDRSLIMSCIVCVP